MSADAIAKLTPAGALPVGGLPGLPATAMNCAVPKVQVVPPPVKLAVMVPLPVADGPETVGGAGATLKLCVACGAAS